MTTLLEVINKHPVLSESKKDLYHDMVNTDIDNSPILSDDAINELKISLKESIDFYDNLSEKDIIDCFKESSEVYKSFENFDLKVRKTSIDTGRGLWKVCLEQHNTNEVYILNLYPDDEFENVVKNQYTNWKPSDIELKEVNNYLIEHQYEIGTYIVENLNL